MGVILAKDMVDVVEEEATKDMYRMAVLAGERIFGPLMDSLKHRLPWLYLNLVTAFLAVVVVSAFEFTIVKVVALAVFLPVRSRPGRYRGHADGHAGSVRTVALGDLPPQAGFRLPLRELF